MALIPKGCIVHSAEIEAKGVEVRYRCDGGGEHRYIDRHGVETVGTYPKPAFARGARAIRFRGMTVSGTGSRVDFVLSPAHAVCKVSRAGPRKAVVCTLKGEKAGDLAGLAGPNPERIAEDMLVNYGDATAREVAARKLRGARTQRLRRFWREVGTHVREGSLGGVRRRRRRR